MLDGVAFSLLLACIYGVATMPQAGSFPAPFTRVLTLEDPPMEGMHTNIIDLVGKANDPS